MPDQNGQNINMFSIFFFLPIMIRTMYVINNNNNNNNKKTNIKIGKERGNSYQINEEISG